MPRGLAWRLHNFSSDVQQEEELLVITDLEQEPEEVQYTDTSYTSASFESLPPVPEGTCMFYTKKWEKANIGDTV